MERVNLTSTLEEIDEQAL